MQESSKTLPNEDPQPQVPEREDSPMFDTNDENIFLDDIPTTSLSKGTINKEAFRERALTLVK